MDFKISENKIEILKCLDLFYEYKDDIKNNG